MAKTVNPLDDLRQIAGAMNIASQVMILRRMGFDMRRRTEGVPT